MVEADHYIKLYAAVPKCMERGEMGEGGNNKRCP